MALWSLCLLSAFAVILGYRVRQELVAARRLDERCKLRFIAQAGIKKAIMELTQKEIKTYDCLDDGWSDNAGAFGNIKIGDGEFTASYNELNTKSGFLETHYGLIDEERKINLNKVSAEVLARLFKIILSYDDTRSSELAAAIVDWRDNDSETSILSGSAEDSYYNSLSFPYGAKNSELEVLDELTLIKGIDDNVFEKIRGYVTIYGDGRVNVNTASEAVLCALGLNENIAGKIISYRLGEDGKSGTSDDNIFVVDTQIAPKLSQFYQFSPSDAEELINISTQYLNVQSNNFMIQGAAKSIGKNTMTVKSVVNRKGKILYWRED